MLPQLRYLDFANRWFGRVKYDLAASNPKPVAASEIGSAAPDDKSARAAFQSAVAARYGVPTSEVVPVLGTSGGLFAAFAALVGEGDHVVVEEPGYEPTWRVPAGLGATVTRWQRSVDDGYAVHVDAVLERLTSRTRVAALTNPHNPTGALVPDETLAALADALRPRGITLLVDEAYLERTRPAFTARRLAPNIVTCASTTKCWGVPWARAGWLLMPEHHVEAAVRAERHACGVAPPSAWAWGALALSAADRLAERVERMQEGKRAVVDGFVAKHARALSWFPPPSTSLYGFVRHAGGENLTPTIERGIREHGVIVSPGEFFGAPSAFRLSWTAEKPVVEEGLECLEKVLGL